MRPITRQSARLATCSKARQSTTTRKCHCEQHRAFSTSVQRGQEPRSPGSSANSPAPINERRGQERKHENGGSQQEQTTEHENTEQRTASDAWTHARRRTLRQKSGDVPKPPPIPEWFLKHNVRLYRDFPGEPVSTDAGEVIRCIDTTTGHTLFTLPYQGAVADGLIKKNDAEKTQRQSPSEHDQTKSNEAATSSKKPETSTSYTNDGQARPEPTTSKQKVATEASLRALGLTSNDIAALRLVAQRDRNLIVGPGSSFLEAEASIRAAFSLADQNPRPPSFAADRVDVSLQCVAQDVHDQMNEYVQDLAAILQADLLTLDANDFAELLQDYVGHGYDEPGSVSALAYDVYEHHEGPAHNTPQGRSKAKDEEEEDEDEEESSTPSGLQGSNLVLFGGAIDLRKLLQLGRNQLGNIQLGQQGQSSSIPQGASGGRGPAPKSDPKKSEERLTAILEQLIDAPRQKQGATKGVQVDSNPHERSQVGKESSSHDHGLPGDDSDLPTLSKEMNSTSNGGLFSLARSVEELNERFYPHLRWARRNPAGSLPRSSKFLFNYVTKVNEEGLSTYPKLQLATEARPPSKLDPTQTVPPRTIIHVRDLRDMCDNQTGEWIIHRLVEIVRKRRRLGQQIVIVGSTLQDVPGPFPVGGDHSDPFPFRSMNISPFFKLSVLEAAHWMAFTKDYPWKSPGDKASGRTMEINLRHAQSMLRRLRPDDKTDLLAPTVRGQLDLPGVHFLTEAVLTQDEVQRLVLVAIGLAQSHALSDVVQPIHITLAGLLISRADHAAREGTAFKQHQQDIISKTSLGGTRVQSGDGQANGHSKMERLKKICNAHETRLLAGMVDPHNIKTGFTDVHAPTDVVDALKNLTTLSLLRPDAFKYGVLASDRLPGLLLYGPPGTGKTLLAKAVAKESNATVLEVSGAQIYEKYVGEGEKMVQAVFSLAKKLSPCVVFIDEADAIFGSRGHSANRTSHRQIINQFLREWDGMDDHSVFMMVATNRPFDLDDAVLRRLPRRLLVDLPVAKDRESILGIHLKPETLDSSVSLRQLAEQTPLYSGSDLKNLAVAAALACVREENELAAANREDKDFKLPEKRTLTSKHFEKALTEISASISEDMSSLNAVRKFDEQYGDRKGRRKKRAYGFGASDEMVNEESARVRQSAPTPPAPAPP